VRATLQSSLLESSARPLISAPFGSCTTKPAPHHLSPHWLLPAGEKLPKTAR
jgi:hypothetical protein